MRFASFDALTCRLVIAAVRYMSLTVKRRNPQLFANCKQLKLPARDGKRYFTDVIDEASWNALIAVIQSGKKDVFLRDYGAFIIMW